MDNDTISRQAAIDLCDWYEYRDDGQALEGGTAMSCFYKPLTPEFRTDINTNIDKQIRELNTCHSNGLVEAHKSALNAVRMLISALPDGYLIPVGKEKQ